MGKTRRRMHEFVTSTKELEKLYPESPVLVYTYEKKKPRVKMTREVNDFVAKYGVSPYHYNVHKQKSFIERYLPVTEEGFKRLKKFMKDRKKLYRILREKKKARSEEQALSGVA